MPFKFPEFKLPFKKARQDVTRAIQKGAEAVGIDIMDEFPESEVEKLNGVKQVTIKPLSASEVKNALKQSDTLTDADDFKPVKFVISTDTTRTFSADLLPETGFRVTDPKDKECLIQVTLPEESANCLGKLQHPHGSTIFKVFESNAKEYHIDKSVTNEDNVMNIKQVPATGWFVWAKRFFLTFSGDWFNLMDDKTRLAKVKPGVAIGPGRKHFIVKFYTDDVQKKTVALGLGLVFTLDVIHKELRNLLKESITDEDDERKERLEEKEKEEEEKEKEEKD